VSTVAEGVRVERARARSKPRGAAPSRSRSGAQPRPRLLGGGVLWILLFAVLLAGVVAVNVAVLGLNLQLDQVERERTELDADIAALRSEISTASTTARIERLATKELGLVQADPDEMVYVRLRR
jgi:cell division protein FtsL